jgi:hypothetical protein
MMRGGNARPSPGTDRVGLRFAEALQQNGLFPHLALRARAFEVADWER